MTLRIFEYGIILIGVFLIITQFLVKWEMLNFPFHLAIFLFALFLILAGITLSLKKKRRNKNERG
jgi:hypothetical protein